MVLVRDVVKYLELLAPLALAEEWDNVGLLMGDPSLSIESIMTCLTLTDETVEEAQDRSVQLVVTHHPLPFRPMNRITVETTAGRLIWRLASSQIAVYSAHTSFDSAATGINSQLADGLQLDQIQPLRAFSDGEPDVGGGRIGRLSAEMTLGELADRAKSFLGIPSIQYVGDLDRQVRTVAVACGGADEFLTDAIAQQCDVFLTGEARFHTCIQAMANHVSMLLPGHFASERFSVEQMATQLANAFPDLAIWAAEREQDPLRTL